MTECKLNHPPRFRPHRQVLIVAVLGMARSLSVRYVRVISPPSMRTSSAVPVVGVIVAAISATV